MMQNKKSKKKYISPICTNLNQTYAFTEKLDFSDVKFTKNIFPLNQILNSCRNLKICNASHNNITTINLNGDFDQHYYLEKLDLSNNNLRNFNIGKLLYKCVKLEYINLEENKKLQNITWQKNIENDFDTSINLKKTALTLKSKQILYNKYIEHYSNPSNDLHVATYVGFVTFFSEGFIMIGCEHLLGIQFPKILFTGLLFGSSIFAGYLVQKKLSKLVKQIVNEKLIFDDK